METREFLTSSEIQSLKVLNYIATYDGIIQSKDEIRYLLEQGIEKFVDKKRQHLCAIIEKESTIKIKVCF